jgi:hypothetical protein
MRLEYEFTLSDYCDAIIESQLKARPARRVFSFYGRLMLGMSMIILGFIVISDYIRIEALIAYVLIIAVLAGALLAITLLRRKILERRIIAKVCALDPQPVVVGRSVIDLSESGFRYSCKGTTLEFDPQSIETQVLGDGLLLTVGFSTICIPGSAFATPDQRKTFLETIEAMRSSELQRAADSSTILR